MGLFDRKPKPDFSNVQGGSSTRPDPTSPTFGGAQPGASTYTVKAGDTLSAIAKHAYGDANQWQRIFEANRDLIEDPDMIHPGQELNIPARDGGGL